MSRELMLNSTMSSSLLIRFVCVPDRHLKPGISRLHRMLYTLHLILVPSLNRFSQPMISLPVFFFVFPGNTSALCSIGIHPVMPSASRTTIPRSRTLSIVPSSLDAISTSSILKNGWSRIRCSNDNRNTLSTGLYPVIRPRCREEILNGPALAWRESTLSSERREIYSQTR